MSDCESQRANGVDGAHPAVMRREFVWSWFPNAKARMVAWLLAIFGLTVFFGLVGWLVKLEAAMGRVEKRLALESLAHPPGASAEQQEQLRALETRFARVVGASVDTKLRILEKSVEKGSLTVEDLRLMEAVTGELRFLRTHPREVSDAAVDSAEHPRFQPLASAQRADLLNEIAELRTLFYSVAIVTGVAAIVAGGLWFGYGRRVSLIAAPPRYQLPVIKAPEQKRRR